MKVLLQNRWEICLSMREQNEPRNCVEYTQRVFTKRHNRVNIAKCLYKINDCFMLKINHTEFFTDVLFQYPAIVSGGLSVCIRSETVVTLLSKNFECLHENRGKSCILQPRKLYEPLFLRLYLRYQ